jgi:hypothetical protein
MTWITPATRTVPSNPRVHFQESGSFDFTVAVFGAPEAGEAKVVGVPEICPGERTGHPL